MKRYFSLFLLSVTLLSGCSNLLFMPEKNIRFTPARFNMPYEDLSIPSTDGITLNAWYIPAICSDKKDCPSKANILFLHGNAENISSHTFSVLWLTAHNYNLIALDYRGFGKSEGSVNLLGAEKDIQAAADYILEKYPDKPLFVFGQSIGAALTASAIGKYDKQDKLAGVIMDSGFSKARQIAREKISKIWVLGWILQYPLSYLVPENDAASHVSRITVPKLFLTTLDDAVVSPHHTRTLYSNAVKPKELEIVETGGHIRALNNSDAKNTFLKFLDKYSKTK